MNKIELRKELYKNKPVAYFSHYAAGNLYYTVDVMGSTYQFCIKAVEDGKLSSDLGTTPFSNQMKASELNRWMQKSIDSGEFIRVK